jgi:hypothetical protein
MLIALALVGATCLVLGVISPAVGPWWSNEAVTIGPAGTSRCFAAGECEAYGHHWIGGSALWPRTAVATLAAGAITAIALIALAASLASRRAGRLAAGATLSGVLAATVSGVAFVVTFPGLDGVGLARGAYFYGAGVIGAAAAAALTLRGTRRAIAATG